MTSADVTMWFWTPRPRPAAALRLMCFPHAGADAPAFLDFADGLPEDIEVRALRMPTRGASHTGPGVADVHGLAAGVAEALAAVEPPYAVLGQSLGSLVGFEAVRGVVGQRSPVAFLPLSAQPPDQFARRLRAMVGTGPPHADDAVPGPLRFLLSYIRENHQEMRDALDDPAVRRLVVRDIWADLVLFRDYRPAPAPPLDCPVHALVGTEDPAVQADDLAGWGSYTTGVVTVTAVHTGHFMLQAEGAQVARLVARILAPWRAVRPGATRRVPGGSADRPPEER